MSNVTEMYVTEMLCWNVLYIAWMYAASPLRPIDGFTLNPSMGLGRSAAALSS